VDLKHSEVSNFERGIFFTLNAANPSLKPTDYRAAFQASWRLCRVFGGSILAISRVRPAGVRAFLSCLACEVVSRVTSAA